jgi:hypothetical protein
MEVVVVLIPEVMDKLNEYYLTADSAKLYEAREAVEREIDCPQLQDVKIGLSLTSSEVEEQVAESGGVKTAPSRGIVVGKLIRVMASDQPGGSCMIMRVVHCDSENLILGVPGAG